MMIDTRNTTLNQRPKALDVINMDISIYIYLCSMIDALVVKSNSVKSVIARKFISVKNCILGNILCYKRNESRTFNILCYFRNHFAMPLNNSNHRGFIISTTPTYTMSLTTYIGFVGFNFTSKKRLSFIHHRPDLLEHTPCCFIGYASSSLKCFSRVTSTGI